MRLTLLVACLGLLACKDPPPAAPPPPASPAAPASQPVAKAGSQPADQPGSQPADPASKPSETEVASTVDYKDARCRGGVAPCPCAGTLKYGQNAIAQIGISEADLAAGTPCLLADLDGNGIEDIVFVGKDYGTAPAVPVKILLFDKLGLRDAPAFPKRVKTLSVHQDGDQIGLLEPTSRLFFHYADSKIQMKKL